MSVVTPRLGRNPAQRRRAQACGEGWRISLQAPHLVPVLFLGIPLLAPGHTTVASWIVGARSSSSESSTASLALLQRNGDAPALAQCRPSRDLRNLSWSRNPLYNGNFLVWMVLL